MAKRSQRYSSEEKDYVVKRGKELSEDGKKALSLRSLRTLAREVKERFDRRVKPSSLKTQYYRLIALSADKAAGADKAVERTRSTLERSLERFFGRYEKMCRRCEKMKQKKERAEQKLSEAEVELAELRRKVKEMAPFHRSIKRSIEKEKKRERKRAAAAQE